MADPLPPELLKNLPPEALAVFALLGQQGQGQDLPVFDGTKKTGKRRATTGGFLGEPIEVENTRLSSEVYFDLFKWDQATLRKFQTDAFKAGAYGTDDPTKIQWGQYDESTQRIWKSVVDQSAGFLKVGRKITPLGVLQEAIQLGAPGLGDGGGGAQPRNPTADDDIVALGRQAASEGLGKELTEGQAAKLTSAFRAEEAPTLGAKYGGEVRGSAGWQEWARTQVREFDPTRFDARRVVDVAEVFEKMLGGGRG